MVGVPAASATVLHVLDQQAFLVKRFDRARTRGIVSARIHAEDLAQAAGIGPDAKYGQTAKQAIRLLQAAAGADPDIVHHFIRQLAFNTIVGNADAHAKNYSVLLRPTGVALAPLYDAVPVLLYPEYDQKLAMGISGARRPGAVGLDHWRKLARTTGLDVDRVEHGIRDLAAGMEEGLDDAWPGVEVRQRELLIAHVRRNIDAATREQR